VQTSDSATVIHYSNACLTKYEESNSSLSLHCPQCKRKFPTHNNRQLNGIANAHVNQLLVRCICNPQIVFELGIIILLELKPYIKNLQFIYTLYWLLLRAIGPDGKHLMQHKETCPLVMISCEMCPNPIKLSRQDLKTHVNDPAIMVIHMQNIAEKFKVTIAQHARLDLIQQKKNNIQVSLRRVICVLLYTYSN
jgi:hypothetical protein